MATIALVSGKTYPDYFSKEPAAISTLAITDMKYRRLSREELEELKSDFVNFLAANSVVAAEWEALKKQEPRKAEDLIEIFSDIVFDKVLRKIEYLEFKTPKDIKTFRCLPHKIIMLGVKIEGDTELDFTADATPEAMQQILQTSQAELRLYRGEKAYQPQREQELFRMLESGARIVHDGGLYKTLAQLLGEQAGDE